MLVRENGEIAALIDWESSGGAPWQYDIAIALQKIEASAFYIAPDQKSQRIAALMDGYGKSIDELKENKAIIDAFRITEAVDFTYALYITFGDNPDFAYQKGAYQTIVDDSYQYDLSSNEPDWKYSLLGAEATLRRACRS